MAQTAARTTAHSQAPTAARGTPVGRLFKITRGALLVQALIALLVGTGYLLHLPSFGQGGMDARKLAAFLYAFVVLLSLAAWRLRLDRAWLYAVIAVVGFNLVDSTYELWGRGNPDFVPAFAIEAVLLTVYVIGAVALTRSLGIRSDVVNPRDAVSTVSG